MFYFWTYSGLLLVFLMLQIYVKILHNNNIYIYIRCDNIYIITYMIIYEIIFGVTPRSSWQSIVYHYTGTIPSSCESSTKCIPSYDVKTLRNAVILIYYYCNIRIPGTHRKQMLHKDLLVSMERAETFIEILSEKKEDFLIFYWDTWNPAR